MDGTEEYAVAKMRLFKACDKVEEFTSARADFIVDNSNLEELLGRLDL